ncbi:MAG: VOC family protein [Planctomycetes bacterium]|nr:VOC family protein [Planctomycetota bacterium]
MQTRVHINLPVSDLAKSTAFYETLFGQAPSKRRDDYANWRLDAPALHLALVHAPQKAAADDSRHFGVELFNDGDLEYWRERVKNAGLELRLEEKVTCCYAVADKFWAADPDGNEWEFWVRHEDAETMHGEERGAGQCCAPAVGATHASPEPQKKAGGCCTPAAKKATADSSSCC